MEVQQGQLHHPEVTEVKGRLRWAQLEADRITQPAKSSHTHPELEICFPAGYSMEKGGERYACNNSPMGNVPWFQALKDGTLQ